AKADRPPPAKPVRHPTTARGPVVEVRGGATVGASLGPSALLGPTLGASLFWGPWGFGIDGHYLFGLDAQYGVAHVASSLVEAALVGCVRPAVLFGCVEASIGRLGVSGTGITRSNDDATLVERVGARAGVDFEFSPEWAAELSAELVVALSRQVV